MAARRALAAVGCHQCRTTVLNAFLSPSRPVIRACPASTLTRLRSLAHPVRSFSSTPNATKSSETEEGPGSVEHFPEAGSLVEKDTTPDEESETASPSDIPWYLQVEPPSRAPDMEPPPLPAVPDDAPALITTILEYAAEQMGLDDISLLDLRALEPPPALGPKLFMIFGTARSERHLNVSAGRLVRWLRAKHRIHADADGLLGPNEKKTKLRRKAKRAKLLGTMGTDDMDDGISTGWICVHLGTLNRGTEEATIVNEAGRFAGFGIAEQGFTVVFQVMTDARRAEMNLETLWNRMLERSGREESSPAEEPAPEANGDVEEGKAIMAPRTSVEVTPEASRNKLHPLERAMLVSSEGRPSIDSRLSRRFGPKSTPGQARFMSGTSTSDGLHQPLASLADSLVSAEAARCTSEALATDGPEKLRLLGLLGAPIAAGGAQAGRRVVDPAFRNLFGFAVTNLPPETTWSYRLDFAHQTGLHWRRDHELSPTLAVAKKLVRELRLSAIVPSRSLWIKLIQCIYFAQDATIQDRTTVALEALASLHMRGNAVIANDILVAIIEGVGQENPWGAAPSGEALALQTRIEELMAQADLPYMGDSTLIRLMAVYRRQGAWKKFWDCWRTPPRHFRQRSEQLYTETLEAAAQGGPGPEREQWSIHALRQCFHEMAIESPPVAPVGRVRDAIMRCIRAVDPHAERLAGPLGSETVVSTERRESVKYIRALQMMS